MLVRVGDSTVWKSPAQVFLALKVARFGCVYSFLATMIFPPLSWKRFGPVPWLYHLSKFQSIRKQIWNSLKHATKSIYVDLHNRTHHTCRKHLAKRGNVCLCIWNPPTKPLLTWKLRSNPQKFQTENQATKVWNQICLEFQPSFNIPSIQNLLYVLCTNTHELPGEWPLDH